MKSPLLRSILYYGSMFAIFFGILAWLYTVMPEVRNYHIHKEYMDKAREAMKNAQVEEARRYARLAVGYRETHEAQRFLEDAEAKADCMVAYRKYQQALPGRSTPPNKKLLKKLQTELVKADIREAILWKRVLADSAKRIKALEEKFTRMESEIVGPATRAGFIFENQRLKQLIEEQKKDHNKEIAKLESHIAEREGSIRRVTKGRSAKTLVSLEPDGEIILAEPDLGAAWIDLGRVNNVKKGLRFKVFRYIKGGRPKEKGTIEVKKVNDNHAYCAILETKDKNDPIKTGDYYISPLFDKNEKKIFVIAGELVNLRFNMKQLTKKIEEAGAKVEKTVTIQTDFLIAGKNAEADEAFTKALQFGVIIMREKDLFEYLGD